MRIAIAVVLLLACDAKPEPTSVAQLDAKPEPKAQAPEAKAPEAKALAPKPPELGSALTILGEPEPEPAIEAGPAAPSGAVTTQQREQAVLELLAGASPAARFVREDVDADKVFDRGMRDRVAPFEPGGSVPGVKHGNVTVSGGLDRDIVRRIVRAHVNEVRHCYNLGLARDSSLHGKATLQFAVAADGKVAGAAVDGSTLRGTAGETVNACLVKSVRRWAFPKPAGGSVDVVYPFEFTSE